MKLKKTPKSTTTRRSYIIARVIDVPMSCSCCFTGWFLAGQQSTNGKNKSSENNQSANSQIRFATLLSQKLDSFFDVELEATALCRPKMNDLMGSLRRTLDRCDAFVIAHNHGIAAFEQEACRIEAACRSIPCSRFVNENRNRLLPFVSFRRLNQAASRHAKVLLRRRVKVTETAMRNRLKTTVRHDLPPDLEDDPSAANINRSSRMPSAEGGARQRRTEISSRRNLHTRQKNTEPSYVGGVGDVGDAGGADEHEPGTGITGEDAVADNLSVDSEMADLRQVLHQQLDQEPLLPESSPVYLSIVVEATKGLSVQHRRENSRVSGLLDALDTHDRSDGISSNGFRVFSAMSNVLGTFEVGKSGELRSEFQAELHRCLLRSCIPLIHSRDWAFNSLQICKNYNVDHNILMYTYIVWGRRCGKSLGVCMFYAAMALYMEGPFIVAFVSTGLPAVLELLRVIFSFIQSKIESTGRVARFSSSGSRPQIIITTPGQRKEEGITFVGLPKGTANNRGGRNLSHICVDEGAYVDPNVWAKVIIPAMRLQGVSGVFLSSMDTDTQNPFNRLGELKDAKGNPVFNTVRMELVCPECKARKIMDCPHYRYRRPGWLVTSAQEELIHAMSKIMNPTSYYTELYGVTEPDRLYCFKPETINLLFESKGVGLQTTSVIYTMIDYGGGGVGSDTSIVSMMTTGSQKVVVSWSSVESIGVCFGWKGLVYT